MDLSLECFTVVDCDVGAYELMHEYSSKLSCQLEVLPGNIYLTIQIYSFRFGLSAVL